MKKRLLSLLLVLVMALSLVPSGSAATAVTYKYNFMRLRTGSWSTAAYQPSQVTSWGWEGSAARSVYGVAKKALEVGMESEETLAIFQTIVDTVEGK